MTRLVLVGLNVFSMILLAVGGSFALASGHDGAASIAGFSGLTTAVTIAHLAVR